MDHNLIFAQHLDQPGKNYIFTLPLEKSVKKGEILIATTKKEVMSIVFASSDSFTVDEDNAKSIILDAGGYFPPAKIIASVVCYPENDWLTHGVKF